MNVVHAWLVHFAQHVKDVASRIGETHRSIRSVNIAIIALLEIRFERVRRLPGGGHAANQRHRDRSVGSDDCLAAELRLVPYNYFELIISANRIRDRLLSRGEGHERLSHWHRI